MVTMKCKGCEWYKNDICIKAENISEVDDISCLLRLNHILLRDILMSLNDDEGDEWKNEDNP